MPAKDTPFQPANGFKFANKFKVHFHAGPIDVPVKGLCGGMSYAALDYYFTNTPLPADTDLPVTGSALETYIFDRQLEMMVNTGGMWAERATNYFGWRTLEFYNWGIQDFAGGQLELLRKNIDAGRPCPLGLVSPNTDLAKNHVVVATGYTETDPGGDGFANTLQVRIYDPNHPGQINWLVAHNDTMRYVENTEEQWLTYFVDLSYRPRKPKVSTSPCGDHKGKQVSGKDLSGHVLSKQDFRCARCVKTSFLGATAMQTDFGNANLTRADFYGANARNSNFGGTTADKARFYGADLQSTTFSGAKADNANFHGANLSGAALDRSRMDHGDFYGADLGGADLSGGRFRGANFYGADLSNADLSEADCAGAVFTGANLNGARTKDSIGVR